MQLTVKNLQHVSHVFEDVNPDETVETFSVKVKEIFKYPDGVRLIYCGRILEKDKQMSEYFKEVNNGFVVAMPEKTNTTSAKPVSNTNTSHPIPVSPSVININTNTNTNTNANINLPTVALTNSTQTYTLDQIRTIMFVFARVIKATPDMFYMFCTNDTQFEQFLASPIFTSGILQPLANASTNITQSLQNGIDFTVPISMNTIQTELSNTNLTSSFNNIISSNPGSTGSLTQTDSAPLTFGHNGENGDNGDNENNDDVNQTTLTQQDNNNIQELCDLGFDITLVTQTYIMTGKNKELAASMLIDFTG